MSDTPRTDQADDRGDGLVEASFARTLETELAAMTSKHQAAVSCLADERRKKEHAIAERDSLAHGYGPFGAPHDMVIAKLTAERDAFKAVLENIVGHLHIDDIASSDGRVAGEFSCRDARIALSALGKEQP